MGISDCSNDELAYNLDLLIESGFVKGTILPNAMPVVTRLTWEGHEFLDNIRDQTIWESVKHRLGGHQSVAISVLRDLALSEVKKKLHLP